MWGPEGLTRALAAALEERLPRVIETMRDRVGADAVELPDVAEIFPTPRSFAAIGQFPAVMLVARDTEGRISNRQIEATGEYDEYQFVYRVRAMIYATGPSYDRTELLVQRLTLAVREAFLLDKRLGNPDEGRGGTIDPQLIRESYAETVENASGQFLSGAWVEIGVTSSERLDAPVSSRRADLVGWTLEQMTHPDMLDEP